MSIMSPPFDDLFPVPSPPASHLLPTRWPGVSPESVDALRTVLKDNHERFHILLNDIGHHNHSSHRLIALWALGMNGDIIRRSYEHDNKFQRPAAVPPEPITEENYNDHLEDRSYHSAYLQFFAERIRQHGISATLEKYVFSIEANFKPGTTTKTYHPMFDRFIGGLYHPLIHTGYGLEFGIPGMVVEGLAQAVVHPHLADARIPYSYFESSINRVAAQLKSATLSDNKPPAKGLHAFSILARVLKDPQFDAIAYTVEMYWDVTDKYRDTLLELVSEWQLDATNPQDVEKKIEELTWMNTIIFGIGGWKGGKDFASDFWYMHLVNSALFLPSYITYLSPSSLDLLLRSYLLISISWWIARGRAKLDIKGFFDADTAYPTPSSGPLPIPHKSTFMDPSSPRAVTPNPWLSIVESLALHPDDHVPKLTRALAHFGSLYGTRAAGLPDFAETELPFADRLDGTLFIRVAGLTARRMGRIREGEQAVLFDRAGFYTA